MKNRQSSGRTGWRAGECSDRADFRYVPDPYVNPSNARTILWFSVWRWPPYPLHFWKSEKMSKIRQNPVWRPKKGFWGGPQATTKRPKKIFFENIIFEPKHIQKLLESDHGARRTVQKRENWRKSTNFGQNQQTSPNPKCRTTLNPTVVRVFELK